MPPIVQNAPLDGSTGKRSPCFPAAAFTESRSAPGPTRTHFFATSTGSISLMVLKSTITPGPMAPPGMLLPDPRGTSDSDCSRAQRTSVTTSSASTGTATARGMIRPMPAASEYAARASMSSRKTPRKPSGRERAATVVKVPATSRSADPASSRRSRVRISCRTFPRSPSA